MFGKFSKKVKPPKVSKDNPGMGHTVQVAYANEERTWEEEFDLIKCLSSVLRQNNIDHETFDSFIVVLDDVFLLPQIVSLEPLEEGGANTATTIEVISKTQIPEGIFEYQHSTGDTAEDSIIKGFESWAATDLQTIREALTGLTDCTSITFENSGDKEDREIVLGPITYAVSKDIDIEEDHPFCPCCLFTNNYDAFRSLIDGDDVLGIRFFVLRNEDGTVEADCRVNGRDFESGKQSLLKYGQTWPDRGLEYRKQYVFAKSCGKE